MACFKRGLRQNRGVNHPNQKRPYRIRQAATWPATAMLALLIAEQGWPGLRNVSVAPLKVTTWNVENLFDWEDDPANPGDDEFTPSSWRRWDEARYRTKLVHLATVIARTGSDVVALQEIENRRVLDDLRELLRIDFKRDYPHLIHRESTDHRGVDVALLSAYPPVETTWITPIPGQRDVLEACFQPHGHTLTLFVVHSKSRWGGKEETDPQRQIIASAIRQRVERRLGADPSQAVLVMGDFNDDHDEDTLTAGLGSTPNAPDDGGLLWNLHATLPPDERGTFYYAKEQHWNRFDSMHASPAMRPNASGSGWRMEAYGVHRHPDLLTRDGHPKAFRLQYDKAHSKYFFQYGYSDHFPVSITLCQHAQE